jgi:putative zinc finger/helix-turn-helix YgiT family protein
VNAESVPVKQIVCPVCGKGVLESRVITERFDYGDGEEKVSVVAENVPVRVCTHCHETFSGPDAARIRHLAICRALGLLTPDEIRAIRERLGLSQVEFAKLTDIGEATISRWERGRLLQNKAMDRYLRLLDRNPDNVRILNELRPEGISNHKVGKPERTISKGGDGLIKEFNRRRAGFLCKALEDAKKWCVAPETLVIPDRKRSDQFWLQLFSSDSKTVTAGDAHQFLVSFQLTNRVAWDKEAVARRIVGLRQQVFSPIPEAVSELAEELGGYILNANKGQRTTSAASKIAFFAKPLQDVYIWDKFARLSARFRDPQSRGFNDYAPFHASCAKALAQERGCEDFRAAVEEFRRYLQEDVEGPMAEDPVLASSFIERRLLDKLMYWEGEWLSRAATPAPTRPASPPR